MVSRPVVFYKLMLVVDLCSLLSFVYHIVILLAYDIAALSAPRTQDDDSLVVMVQVSSWPDLMHIVLFSYLPARGKVK